MAGAVKNKKLMVKIKERMKKNQELNWKEFLDGKTILKSYPVKLGIDIEGRCNFKPACVYCSFDSNKKLEGSNVEIPFNENTFKELGPFFENASSLINCSIGEPFLSQDIIKLFRAFEKNGKLLEMATNGLLLNKKNRNALLGKNINLYISLDAATKETFAKLRNQHFEKIVDNVRRLSAKRKKFNGLPKIFLVFMPMKINLNELEDFVKLCADLEADKMILRPLNAGGPTEPNRERGGYKFVYDDELLSFEKMIAVSRQAKKYSDKYNVNLSDQLNFGSENINNFISNKKTLKNHKNKRISDKVPICKEPWTNFYILRRGVMPCCYGYELIAEMKKFKKTWNGTKLQNIRRYLAKKKLSGYCLRSKSCPIVQKYFSEHKMNLFEKIKIKLFNILLAIAKKFGLQKFKKYFLIFVR